MVKEGLLPSSGCLGCPWLSCNTKNTASRALCSVGVNCYKESGISLASPAGGRYSKVNPTWSLFSDSISSRKLQYRNEKQQLKMR